MIDYQRRLAAESRQWEEHLQVEKSGEWYGWLDHPRIVRHYQDLRSIDGLSWEAWALAQLGGPASRSLDLGCGSGSVSLSVYLAGVSAYLEGMDISTGRIAEAEKARTLMGAPGRFWVADVNTVELEANHYDLIFSAHSFHHFLQLEHIMAQVHAALTPNGLFILEEFVGPTQFQWTDAQLVQVEALLAQLPRAYRHYRPSPATSRRGWRRWAAPLRAVYHSVRTRYRPYKSQERRPTRAQVAAVSPFESIRSGEIVPLFRQYFDVVALRPLGGTLQHLLYNRIIHNFNPQLAEANRFIDAIYSVEDTLIQAGLLPSDFMLLVGRKRG